MAKAIPSCRPVVVPLLFDTTLNLYQIADRAGVTVQRVYQIAEEFGVSTAGRTRRIPPLSGYEHPRARRDIIRPPCPRCGTFLRLGSKGVLGNYKAYCCRCGKTIMFGETTRAPKERAVPMPLNYPYLRNPPSSADEDLVAHIHSTVPRGAADRADVCQDLLVDVLQGKQRDVKQHLRRYRSVGWREVSLSSVGLDGRTLGARLGIE